MSVARPGHGPLILTAISSGAMGLVMMFVICAIVWLDLAVGTAVIAAVIPFSAAIALTFMAARTSASDARHEAALHTITERLRLVEQALTGLPQVTGQLLGYGRSGSRSLDRIEETQSTVSSMAQATLASSSTIDERLTELTAGFMQQRETLRTDVETARTERAALHHDIGLLGNNLREAVDESVAAAKTELREEWSQIFINGMHGNVRSMQPRRPAS